VDYRSDQFSFGLIVCEMLEGKQAFARDSSVETMAATVRDEAEPPRVKIPVPLKWLVERCLEKDLTRRFDSSRDLYQRLRVLRDHFSEAFSSSIHALSPDVAAAQQAVARRKRFGVGVTLALMILSAGLAGGIVWGLHPKGCAAFGLQVHTVRGERSQSAVVAERQNGRVLRRNGRRRPAFSAHTGFTLAAAVDSQHWRHASPRLVAGLLAYPLPSTNTWDTTARAALRWWRVGFVVGDTDGARVWLFKSADRIPGRQSGSVDLSGEGQQFLGCVYLRTDRVPTASLPRFAGLFA